MIAAPILVRLDLGKPFILDVDWYIKGVRSVLSQKQDKHECVVTYASKGLTPSQKKFHPMEGECYALIWGIMHFRQYLYQASFVVKIDRKPLEHSYEILGAGMLWKPKEARILMNFIDQPVNIR